MKKRLILSFVLALTLVLASFPISGASFGDGVGKDEIPYGDFDSSNTAYRYGTFNMMTAEEAAAANVPDGYSGYVLELTAAEGGVGVGLDLSQYRVKDIEKITFRIWCPATTKDDGVRLTNYSSSSWIMLTSPGEREEWVDIVLDEESNFNTNERSFDAFDDGTGYCKSVNFCIRFTGSNETVYIDSITVELKDPDTEAPVITYDGENVIETTAGRTLAVDATAYDKYEDKNIDPEYIFSEGAVDENGLLLEGEHTCTVRFSDFAGNSSEIKLTVKVAPKDEIAPVLSWAPDKLYANDGMMPVFNITATDDHDGEVDVTLTWSEGALYRGKLCNGNHTLTVSAVDKTGNKVEKVIPVVVESGLPSLG